MLARTTAHAGEDRNVTESRDRYQEIAKPARLETSAYASALNATTGGIRLAWRAGMRIATTTAASSTAVTAASVMRSCVPTLYSLARIGPTNKEIPVGSPPT